jgi:muramoyltetrapeptide carboxypeptidase LdcA involved in peptidoglycan recycling
VGDRLVTGMDLGHTDPFLTLPVGVRAELDCEVKELRVVEAILSD